MIVVLDIYAIYIVMDDGRELFKRVYRGTPASTGLLMSFIAAIRSFCEETTGSSVDEIRSGDLFYYIKQIDPIIVIVLTSSRKNIESIAETIAYRFIDRYGGALQNWKGQNIFQDFQDTLDKLLDMKGVDRGKVILEPNKVLDAITVLKLNPNLQKTALALIGIKRGTIQDIIKNTNKSVDETKKDLKALINMGYVGKVASGSVEWYFVK